MKHFKKPLFFLLTILLTVGMVSCGDDDSKDSGPAKPSGSQLGTAALTLSGDVDGERSGIADFEMLDLGGIVQMWHISILDFSPQTFTVELNYSVANASTPQPGPGTYAIGVDSNNPTEQYFSAEVTLIENEDYENANDYTTILTSTGAGTLTITKSNDQEISGTLQFTALEYDDMLNVIGTITVSGSFSAVPS